MVAAVGDWRVNTQPARPHASLANLLPGAGELVESRSARVETQPEASATSFSRKPHTSVCVSQLNRCNLAPRGAGVDGRFPPTPDTSSSVAQVPAVPWRACRISFYRTSPHWSYSDLEVNIFFFEITSALSWEEAFRSFSGPPSIGNLWGLLKQSTARPAPHPPARASTTAWRVCLPASLPVSSVTPTTQPFVPWQAVSESEALVPGSQSDHGMPVGIWKKRRRDLREVYGIISSNCPFAAEGTQVQKSLKIFQRSHSS